MNGNAFSPCIIEDKKLKLTMDMQALPFLNTIMKSGKTSAGLYYEAYPTENARGAIVISHGFCESIEKYKEMIYYFVKAGFQVYLADHRGHGRSRRDTAHPNMVHIKHFTDYTEDLHSFITEIVKPSAGSLPLYLYAHSMGGAIGVLYLETWPDTFKKAVLNAPMLRINMGPFPLSLALALAFIMKKLHREEHYAPGQHAFVSGERYTESGSACEERFQYYQDKKDTNACFQTSGSSYGWAYESIHACSQMLKKENCARIPIPVLVFQAEKDILIKASGLRRFLKYTKSASLIKIPGSKHEIYNSTASVLKAYYRAVFTFLTEHF